MSKKMEDATVQVELSFAEIGALECAIAYRIPRLVHDGNQKGADRLGSIEAKLRSAGEAIAQRWVDEHESN
jgi:hypothetical protein